MKTQLNNASKSLALLFSSIFLAVSLSGCENAEAINTAEEKEEVIAIPVEVAALSHGQISSKYTSTAVLEAKAEAQVISKVSGIIEDIYVEEGDYVEAGQLLAQIETERLQLSLSKMRAELKGIEEELKRIEGVHSKNLVSTDTYDKLKWQHEATKAALQLAELNLRETRIIAPISGFIAKRYVKPGNLVEKYQAMALYHIVQQKVLEGHVHLPEQELARVKVGQHADLSLASMPNAQVAAVVNRISPTVDSETGTVRVTLLIDNPEQQLKSGMFAEVELNYDTRSNALLLPKSALITVDNKHTVYSVSEDNKAIRHTVVIGYQEGEYAEVLQGLDADKRVVVAGHQNLKDQAAIEVIDNI